MPIDSVIILILNALVHESLEDVGQAILSSIAINLFVISYLLLADNPCKLIRIQKALADFLHFSPLFKHRKR